MPKPPALDPPQLSAHLLLLPNSKKPRRETAPAAKGSGSRSHGPMLTVHDEIRCETPPFHRKHSPQMTPTSTLNGATLRKPRGDIPPFSEPKQAIPNSPDPLRRR
jgi:hypothetical protein